MEVEALSEKVREKLLGRFGHVMRKDKSHVTLQAIELMVDRTRQEGGYK